MNKKLFGIKIGTYFMLMICLLASFLIWIFVNLPTNDEESETDETSTCLVDTGHTLIL